LFELPINPWGEDSVRSEEIAVSDTQTIAFNGVVDRVDIYRQGQKTYFRVVDYKTGSKDFVLGELPYGLNTQMLLYLYVICDNSRRWLKDGDRLHPAGVLYHPVTDLTVAEGTKDMQKARLKLMRMDGIVLDDASVVLAMEQEPDKVFIPAALAADGTPGGSVVSERQFALLRGVIEQLLTNMASTLLTGDIAALPLKNNKHDACQYCDYRAVCARDADAPVRPLEPLVDKALLEALDKEVDDDADACMDRKTEAQH
jgi:ATP-dependent helicase/nuclease subunit B